VELALRTDRKPERVTLQPGDRTVEWVWRDGEVRATIPLESVQIHSILELTSARQN
jgi:plastocyanin